MSQLADKCHLTSLNDWEDAKLPLARLASEDPRNTFPRVPWLVFYVDSVRHRQTGIDSNNSPSVSTTAQPQ